MKKAYKVISILTVALMMILVGTSAFAAISMDSISPNTTVQGQENITKLGNQILSIVTSVGMVVAVIILAVIGIKYMVGSAEQKSEYKKTFIPYFVGAILVFGACGIGKVVVNIGQQVLK